jgi:hypothetical protein
MNFLRADVPPRWSKDWVLLSLPASAEIRLASRRRLHQDRDVGIGDRCKPYSVAAKKPRRDSASVWVQDLFGR